MSRSTPLTLAALAWANVLACALLVAPGALAQAPSPSPIALPEALRDRPRAQARAALLSDAAAWLTASGLDELVLARGDAPLTDEADPHPREWTFARRGTSILACERELCADAGHAARLGPSFEGQLGLYEPSTRTWDALLLERAGASLRIVRGQRTTFRAPAPLVDRSIALRDAARPLPPLARAALGDDDAWRRLHAIHARLGRSEEWGENERIVAQTLAERGSTRITLVTYADDDDEDASLGVVLVRDGERVLYSPIALLGETRVEEVLRDDAPLLVRTLDAILSVGVDGGDLRVERVATRVHGDDEMAGCPQDPSEACVHVQLCEREIAWDDERHAHLGPPIRRAYRVPRGGRARPVAARFVGSVEENCPEERSLCLDPTGLGDCAGAPGAGR